jgi:hypothetical protein
VRDANLSGELLFPEDLLLIKDFRLRTEERQIEKSRISKSNDQVTASPSSLQGYVRRDNGELKPVRLYVEIKLGGGVKASHIAVADHDVPSELAKSFCRIYSLDSNAENILTEVVTNQMNQSGIPIGTSPIKSLKMKSQKLTKDDLQNEEGSSSMTHPQYHKHPPRSSHDLSHQSEKDYLENHYSETYSKYEDT